MNRVSELYRNPALNWGGIFCAEMMSICAKLMNHHSFFADFGRTYREILGWSLERSIQATSVLGADPDQPAGRVEEENQERN